MNTNLVRNQQGMAMVMVLILLTVGSLLLVPALQFAATALTNQQIAQNDMWTSFAVDALSEHALWELQYGDEFEDCVTPLDGTPDSFVDCVGEWGSWTLTTSLEGITNETLVPKVNGQDASVSVEVPGALTAPPEPTPTPTAAKCLYGWVERDTDPTTPGDQTWVQVGTVVPVPLTLLFGVSKYCCPQGLPMSPAAPRATRPRGTPKKACARGWTPLTPAAWPTTAACYWHGLHPLRTGLVAQKSRSLMALLCSTSSRQHQAIGASSSLK